MRGTYARIKFIAIVDRSLGVAGNTGFVNSSGSFGSAFSSSRLRPRKVGAGIGLEVVTWTKESAGEPNISGEFIKISLLWTKFFSGVI